MASFFLFLFSLALVVEGVMMILVPKKLVNFVKDMLKIKEPKLLGIPPLAVGILLLLSASASALGWLVVFFGLFSIGKSVYTFLTPIEKIKSLKWFRLTDNAYRVLGIIVLVFGVLIFISRA